MSDSLQPHGLQPVRFLCPWNSQGKNTCCPPGDLPNPGIKPMSLISPTLAGGFFTTSTTLKAQVTDRVLQKLNRLAGGGDKILKYHSPLLFCCRFQILHFHILKKTWDIYHLKCAGTEVPNLFIQDSHVMAQSSNCTTKYSASVILPHTLFLIGSQKKIHAFLSSHNRR